MLNGTVNNIVTVGQDELAVDFNRFDLDAYQTFLKCKTLPEYRIDFDEDNETYLIKAPSRFASYLGAEPPRRRSNERDLSSFLRDYQAWTVRTALDARRYAVWADCGLGKTLIFLEWALCALDRCGGLSDGRVVIFSPANVIWQTVSESAVFYDDYPIQVIESREGLDRFCKVGAGVGIVNYEKMIPGVLESLRFVDGIVLDESSILKSGGGTIKWNLIKSAKGVPYKLSCTATPAPNDTMEYASQASFLEVLRHEGEILWTYFSRDKFGRWFIKPHAEQAFYRFMSGWSIYMRDPARHGFKDSIGLNIPEPEMIEHTIAMTPEQAAEIQRVSWGSTGEFITQGKLGITQRGRLSQAAKGFVYDRDGGRKDVRPVASNKPATIAAIAERELDAGNQTIIWTEFDAEADILVQAMKAQGLDDQVRVISGDTKKKDRPGIVEAFKRGEFCILITKASLMGYGINLQNAGAMIFSGWSDSFERWYQAVRRAVRYGQVKHVRIHVPVVPDLEGDVLDNVNRKAIQFEADVERMERNYIKAAA